MKKQQSIRSLAAKLDIITVALVVLLVIGGIVAIQLVRHSRAKNADSTTALVDHQGKKIIPATTTAAENDEAAANPDKTFTITIGEHKLKSGSANMTVNKGDAVRVNIKVAEDEERIHLDGYNINTEGDPDAPGGFTFIATESGRFKYYAMGETGTPDEGKTYPLGIITVK